MNLSNPLNNTQTRIGESIKPQNKFFDLDIAKNGNSIKDKSVNTATLIKSFLKG